jgi:hypothetical protein
MGDATIVGGEKSDGSVEPPAGSETDTALKDFIFARELAEVYLLLDHVSTSRTKRLQKNYADLGAVDNGVKSFIADICKITWPPKDNATIPADQAATLILALDTLNSYVAPATGASIAFTTLVAGGDEATPEPARLPVPGRFTAYPTRQSLATWAFPSLPRSAKRFKRWTLWVVCALVVWLILTCALSWNVATGNALLAQLNTLTVEQQTIERKIATAGNAPTDESVSADGSAKRLGAASARASSPGQRSAADPKNGAGASDLATATGSSAWVYCGRFHRHDAAGRAGQAASGASLPAESAAPPQRLDSNTGLPVCDELTQNLAGVRVAAENLHLWLDKWRRIGLADFAADRPSASASDQPGAQAHWLSALEQSDSDSQWAATLLNVLGGAVLPVCYGLLGAGAAVVRGVSAKIRDSLLTPRDFTLSLVQLALGAVIGGCIGLFTTPAGNGAEPTTGLLASVHLSASALCFVAGFGVEGVFVALESLMVRVFDLHDPNKPST